MANKQFVNTHNNVVPNDGGAIHSIWVCDTDAGKPVTGLVVGDLAYAVDSKRLYSANSTTTWVLVNDNNVLTILAGNFVGINNIAPAYALDAVKGAAIGGSNIAKFGDVCPVYLMNGTKLGFNIYLSTVHKFGAGSSSKYGAVVEMLTNSGRLVFYSTDSGNDAGTATITERFAISPSGVSCGGSVVGGFPVVGGGADPPAAGLMGKVNRTGQNASIASVILANATTAGLYRVSYFLRCTTADVTAGTISFSTTYTDSVGATTETSATAALTSTANRANGSFIVDLASGDITFTTTLTGIAGSSFYKLRVRCEYLS